MTPTQEAAMRQALEALEFLSLDFMMLDLISPGREAGYKAITALRAALAEPVQEPVAWYHVPYPNNGISPMVSLSQQHEPSLYGAAVPLYLAPPIMEPEIKVDKEAPVAWLFTNLQSGDYDFCYQEDEHDHDREMWHKQPLYTAPPQRKPLTGVDLRALYDRHAAYQEEGPEASGWWDFARAVERAHGIGV